MKKTIGLIAITNTEKAVLQVRGNFNVEKNKKETYQGASQLTVHGSIEEGESEKEALIRETKEELGEEFASIVQGRSLDKINKVGNKEMSVTNFGIRIAEEDLKKIKFDERTGTKIRLITKNEIGKIRELKPEDRESGVTENEIAMFPDDIGAIKLAFEKLNTGKGLSSRKSILKEER